jgi:hypothetical protein
VVVAGDLNPPTARVTSAVTGGGLVYAMRAGWAGPVPLVHAGLWCVGPVTPSL